MIDQATLKRFVRYEPDTGLFFWNIQGRQRCSLGSRAGTKSEKRYVLIMIDGRFYRAHRLAWLYIFGRWPKSFIDHKDGNRSNNRISNLREATSNQNNANRSRPRGRSGYRGVSWHSRAKRWQAQIRKNGTQQHIGLFTDPREAAEAYQRAAREIHGEFFPERDRL